MRKLSNGLATVAMGVFVLAGGHSATRLAQADESSWQPKSLPGVETAKSLGSSLMSGMEKVGEMIIPDPSVKGAPDPVSLSTKAKPSPGLYLSMATVAEEKKNFAGARKHYEQALEQFPERSDVILQYARFRDRRNELAEATELYQKAARIDPDDAAAFNDLGLCFARRSMMPQSLSALDRAIQLAPDRHLYRNNIATVLVEQGDVDAAFSHLKAVYEESVAYYNLGFLMLKKGDNKAAARLFTEALAKNPSLVEAKIWLRELQRRSVPSRNVQRQMPSQVRSANRLPRRPAENTVISTRPSLGEGAVRSPQPQVTSSPPSHVAPLPPSTEPSEGPAMPMPEVQPPVAPAASEPTTAVPVLQPLPPVD